MNFPNKENIQALRETIYSALDPLITKNYCLLDVPDHENIGDNLIWGGELEYLKRLPYQMEYTANLYLYDSSKVSSNHTILLHGGGNFGDLWRAYQDFKIDVISNFKNNRIIIFPQTVYYQNPDNITKDAAIFNSHPDLTIAARDEPSFELLKKHFNKNNIVLLPDMAFCQDFSAYHSDRVTNKRLVLKRVDKELNTKTNLDKYIQFANGKEVEVKDWPTYNISPAQEKAEHYKTRLDLALSKRLLKVPGISSIVDPRHGIFKRNDLHEHIKTGIDFINQYDEIYSTRLHGYILSILLNKEVNILDNSYGKNSNFHKTWLSDFHKTKLILE